jgi:hypothetical protein
MPGRRSGPSRAALAAEDALVLADLLAREDWTTVGREFEALPPARRARAEDDSIGCRGARLSRDGSAIRSCPWWGRGPTARPSVRCANQSCLVHGQDDEESSWRVTPNRSERSL